MAPKNKTRFDSLINDALLSEHSRRKLCTAFTTAKPFPHILIENFLKDDVATLLAKEIQHARFIEKESDLFHFYQTDDLYFSKNSALKHFNSACLSWEFFSFVEAVTGVTLKGTLDMAATLYESTNYLLPHDDKLDGRKIAYIIYLSKSFTENDGGSFILYNSNRETPTTLSKKIPPMWNSLLLFEVSGISFHEVEENISNKKRYAIGGWLQ
jgi:prolyl 3-hydroxylase /prolyl 3,4-dihydroxylase